MTTQYFDHVDRQYPYALIGPLSEHIRMLELRAHHYVHHVRMTPEDKETIERVYEILANARAELDRLREEAGQPTGD